MAVIGYREVLPRTFSHRFGESPTAERKVVVTVDAPESHQVVIGSVGILHGDSHPEYGYLRMLDAQLSETDRHHVEITYKYELPKQQDLDPNPLARPDVWSFSTGGSQVPALVYYDGSGNGDKRPLTLDLAASVTNAVNSSSYLGGEAHTWFCSGIGGQQASEVVNGQEIRYWQVTVELLYRKSTHDLLLPNVGWNFISGGDRKRCYVIDWDAKEYLPSATPRPLTELGNMKAGDEGPDFLTRRVYPEADFASYFGAPSF